MGELNHTPHTTEEAPPDVDWESIYELWRRGDQLWIRTYGGGVTGGYIVDYSVVPPQVSRWRSGDPLTITPLYVMYRLVHWYNFHSTPENKLCEFHLADIDRMDMEALEYQFAEEYYRDLWFDVPENYSVEDNESSEQRPTTESWGLDNVTPAPPFDEDGTMLPPNLRGTKLADS